VDKQAFATKICCHMCNKEYLEYSPFSTLVIFLDVINQKLVSLVLEKPIATGRYLTMSGDTILKMKK
jgi:hypothetical protein